MAESKAKLMQTTLYNGRTDERTKAFVREDHQFECVNFQRAEGIDCQNRGSRILNQSQDTVASDLGEQLDLMSSQG